MITVVAETVNFSAKLFQFTLSGLSAFRLQCSFLPKISTFYFLPISRAKKLIVASNRRTVDAQVNASNFAGRLDTWCLGAHHYMQKVIALFFTKVATAYFPTVTGSIVFRQAKGDVLSALDCNQGSFAFGKPEARASSIVSNRATVGFWLRYLLAFLFQGKSRFASFTSFDPSRADQLARQIGGFSFGVIGQLVQFGTIFNLAFPSYRRHPIKRICVLLNRLIEDLRLFFGKIEFNFKSKCYHGGYVLPDYSYKSNSYYAFPLALKDGVSIAQEAEGVS